MSDSDLEKPGTEDAMEADDFIKRLVKGLIRAQRRKEEKRARYEEAYRELMTIVTAKQIRRALGITATKLAPEQESHLLLSLEANLENDRYCDVPWSRVKRKVQGVTEQTRWSLYQMLISRGDPKLVEVDTRTDQYIFYDCSKESPRPRRNTYYDRQGVIKSCRSTYYNMLGFPESYGPSLLDSIVETGHVAGYEVPWITWMGDGKNPFRNAVDMSTAMGITILNAEQYIKLQNLQECDLITDSYINSPSCCVFRCKGLRRVGGGAFRKPQFDELISRRTPTDHCSDWTGFRGYISV